MGVQRGAQARWDARGEERSWRARLPRESCERCVGGSREKGMVG